MTIHITGAPAHFRPIVVSRPEEPVDLDRLKADLAKLTANRHITERDETLLLDLVEFKTLSLDQIWRRYWAKAKIETAADRMAKLKGWKLLRLARQPWSKFSDTGLTAGQVFGLGPGGWLWLNQAEPADYAQQLLDPGWVMYQLKMAQLYIMGYESTRGVQPMADLDWTSYHGFPEPEAGQVTPSPNALVVLSQQNTQGLSRLSYFINLPLVNPQPGELFDWAPFIQAYDDWFAGDWQHREELRQLRTFPAVLVILQTEDNVEALDNLAEMIQQKRQQPIAYYLTAWPYLFKDKLSLLKKPIWLQLTPKGKRLGQAHGEGVSLLKN